MHFIIKMTVSFVRELEEKSRAEKNFKFGFFH